MIGVKIALFCLGVFFGILVSKLWYEQDEGKEISKLTDDELLQVAKEICREMSNRLGTCDEGNPFDDM